MNVDAGFVTQEVADAALSRDCRTQETCGEFW